MTYHEELKTLIKQHENLFNCLELIQTLLENNSNPAIIEYISDIQQDTSYLREHLKELSIEFEQAQETVANQKARAFDEVIEYIDNYDVTVSNILKTDRYFDDGLMNYLIKRHEHITQKKCNENNVITYLIQLIKLDYYKYQNNMPNMLAPVSERFEQNV